MNTSTFKTVNRTSEDCCWRLLESELNSITTAKLSAVSDMFDLVVEVERNKG